MNSIYKYSINVTKMKKILNKGENIEVYIKGKMYKFNVQEVEDEKIVLKKEKSENNSDLKICRQELFLDPRV